MGPKKATSDPLFTLLIPRICQFKYGKQLEFIEMLVKKRCKEESACVFNVMKQAKKKKLIQQKKGGSMTYGERYRRSVIVQQHCIPSINLL